jgi:hypothetical protein
MTGYHCFKRVKDKGEIMSERKKEIIRERRILDHGYYSVFENEYGRRVLVLDGKQWFVWTEDTFGPLLTLSEPWTIQGNGEYKIIMQGKFFLEDIENDIYMPHLFLEEDGTYMEIILPQGLPGTIDTSKTMIISNRVLPPEFVEYYDDFISPSHQVRERNIGSF